MSDLRSKLYEIYSLEQIAAGTSPIHRLHPAAKLLAALCVVLTALSFDRYAFTRLLPFLLYPCVLASLADVPSSLLIKRTAIALPFCLFAGVSNIIFEREFVSCATLILRTLLCVSAIVLLAATTPILQMSAQLRKFRVPAVFVTLIEMTYRYAGVLLAEACAMHLAYSLRRGEMRGIDIAHAGSFVGHLFLRSADRAERVYAAMKCRGYSSASRFSATGSFAVRDGIFLALVFASALAFRLFDIPHFFGSAFSALFGAPSGGTIF